jgi:hypothetical protein
MAAEDDPSVQVFFRFVQERFADFRNRMAQLIGALVVCPS